MLAAVVPLAGCVTENPRPKAGLTRAGGSPAPIASGPRLPEGPIARPGSGTTTIASVSVSVRPAGTVDYDGQVLPLVSPDGRFLAVQQGGAPDWPTLLAQPGAVVPVSTSVAIYALDDSGARRIEGADRLPVGLLVGRSADERGFLVESPRPDGSRWIGRVSWVTAELEWLVSTESVAAHAVATRAGLAYVERSVNGGPGRLVLTGDAGASAFGPDGLDVLMPVPANDDDAVYAIAASPAGLELVAVDLVDGVEPRLGAIRSRAVIHREADPLRAYQACAAVSGVVAAVGDAGWPGSAPMIFHPRLGRMAVYDSSTGLFSPLAAGSFAAARFPGPGRTGYFMATGAGLEFQPDPAPPTAAAAAGTPRARVLADPYVPRSTTRPDRPLVLLGPSRLDPRRLTVVYLSWPEVPGD